MDSSVIKTIRMTRMIRMTKVTRVTRVKLRLLPREHMSHQMAQRKRQRRR